VPITSIKSITSSLVLASTLIALQPLAFAATDAANSTATTSQGYYIQGGLGTFALTAASSIEVDSFSGGAGGLAVFGYQYNQHFALELDAIYGSYSYDDTTYTPTRHYTLDGGLVGPAMKGILPMGEHWHLYGKLGLALFTATGHYTEDGSSEETDDSESIGLPFDAVGINYAINQHVELGVEYTGLIYLAANAGLASFNMTYHY
jgi:hypothetical protein